MWELSECRDYEKTGGRGNSREKAMTERNGSYRHHENREREWLLCMDASCQGQAKDAVIRQTS